MVKKGSFKGLFWFYKGHPEAYYKGCGKGFVESPLELLIQRPSESEMQSNLMGSSLN